MGWSGNGGGREELVEGKNRYFFVIDQDFKFKLKIKNKISLTHYIFLINLK